MMNAMLWLWGRVSCTNVAINIIFDSRINYVENRDKNQ